MVFADKKLGVRSTQCAPNSSQAIARAFSMQRIVAIAAREHEDCVFCFIDPVAGHLCLASVGLKIGSTVMISCGQIAVRWWVVSAMVSADKKLGVRSIQCAPNRSQANARAFNVHQIKTIATRGHEACVSGLEKGYFSDDPLRVNCNALLSRFDICFRGQQIRSSKHSVCSR